jgi:predicted extracellular nuclease
MQRSILSGSWLAFFRKAVHLAGRGIVVFILLFSALFPGAFGVSSLELPAAQALSGGVVISQVYGGGGNSGATLRNDFIELFNRGSSPVWLNGWTVQYAAASGDFSQTTPLTNVTLQPGQYYLVQEGAGAGGSQSLPTPDTSGGINMGATSGKVALVNSTSALNCGSTTTACSASQLALIIDLIGYGSTGGTPANETASAPTLTNTTAALRNSGGCAETDNNSSDFQSGTPNPRNAVVTPVPCGSSSNQPIAPSCGGPLTTTQGTAVNRNVSATDPDGVVLTAKVSGITPTPANGTITLGSVVAASSFGGTLTGILTVDAAVPTGTYTVSLSFTNNDAATPKTVDCSISVTVNPSTGNQPIVPNCGGALSTPQGTGTTRNISAVDADGQVTGVMVSALSPSPAPGSITVGSITPASAVGGTLTAVVTVSNTVPAGNYSLTLSFSNNDPAPQTATCDIAITVTAVVNYTPIYTIQGASRQSPLVGQSVTTEGVVTGSKSNGFFLQDPQGDGNPKTSDGIFVFSTTPVTVGHRVRVVGTVQEYINSSYPDDQPLTEIAGTPTVTDLGAGATITPVIISTDPSRSGPNVRRPPAVIFSTATYDPTANGLDFYESLEGMLVEVDNAVVVGATDRFNDFVVVPDNGTGVTGFTARHSVAISAGDFNPERIMIDDGIVGSGNNPQVVVGDRITVPLVGPLDYSFSNYKIQPLSVISPNNINQSQRVTQETVADLTSATQLRVASYNIENFSSSDTAKLNLVANHIRLNLKAPDLLILVEVQDDSGATDNGIVTANANLTALANAISSNGGPTYSFQYVSPVNNQDGGAPGGNIRQVFFYRTDRGLSFVPKGSAGPTDANTVNADGSLALSPGRIDPTNAAFSDSRKPLAGEFQFAGQRLIVIANHLNSKIGDNPLYGSTQPPVLSSEAKRRDQATIIRSFITGILNADPNANIIVGGDMNDFEFSRPLNILKNNEGALAANLTLTDVVENPAVANERYTYNYEGNSQVIDHLLYSPHLAPRLSLVDIVHLNADFNASSSLRASDHDPLTSVFDFDSTCANPFLVTGATDDGAATTCGTLSYAIKSAQAGQTITFQAGLTQLSLTGALLPLYPGTKIDGGCTADANGRGVPGVSLVWNVAGPQSNALLRLTGTNTLRGLALVNYPDYALEVTGNGNTLSCSWLGTADGTTKQANGGGIRFSGEARDNQIGLPGDKQSGNLIGGNNGPALLDNTSFGSNNRLYYNLIGLNKNGLPLPNTQRLSLKGKGHFRFGLGNRVFG